MDFEKALEEATPEEVLELVESMKRLVLKLAREKLIKMVISNLEKRLATVEELTGNAPVRKSIEGQGDDDGDQMLLWPSLSKVL